MLSNIYVVQISKYIYIIYIITSILRNDKRLLVAPIIIFKNLHNSQARNHNQLIPKFPGILRKITVLEILFIFNSCNICIIFQENIWIFIHK